MSASARQALRVARARQTACQVRHATSSRSTTTGGPPDHNYNTNSAYNYLVEDKAQEFDKYPLVTARSLSQHRQQPRRVKMYTRDFVDDSLYNPYYGYFSKQATILRGPEVSFSSLKDNSDFQRHLAQTYQAFEGQDLGSSPRQVWQTPTEMFKPYYGQAIARYLLTHYKLTSYPYNDLVVYEVGAGNGTLMVDILDYIRETEPEIYLRTRYKVIEISRQLAHKQRVSSVAASAGHEVEIINKSVLDWDTTVPEPCFVLAMEVLDNFAHDAVRYDLLTGQTFQAMVAVDEAADYHEILTPVIDPLLKRYLGIRRETERHALHPSLRIPKWARQLRAHLPFAPNLTSPEFVPTRQLQFLEVLATKFPRHKLVVSDFSSLPDAMEGVCSPVVQTRYRGTMVPCSTYMVYPGYFDIMFPTDFDRLNRVYSAVLARARARSAAGDFFSHGWTRRDRQLVGEVTTHAEFLDRWADVDATKTQSGESPMIEWFQNCRFLTS
ncbi:hypothetical protein PYCC9005_002968 [Savitreella phatthalungensis]